MVRKEAEKQKVIALRKKGLTYREIMQHVPVAKSSICLWLRDVGLAKRHQRRISEKQRLSALRGAAMRHQQRVTITQAIHQAAAREITSISHQNLWLMGIMLYWAEGSKEKEGHPGSGVKFTNSDSKMVQLFMKWLLDVCKIDKDLIHFEILIHENNKYRLGEVVRHWSQTTGFSEEHFSHIYFKRHNPKTKRKNIGAFYYGVLQIKVRRSSSLNRKIAGWVSAIHKNIIGE